MMGQIGSTIVITGAERRGRRKKVQPGNREWATAINCISGDGYSLPPFLLVKGLVNTSTWYTETGIPHDWVVKPTPNGWTNNETGLDWIKHFEKHTRQRTVGGYRMIVLDGHESHLSLEFEAYCKDNNIITISLPSHSSHITQPLDVALFSPLKRAYGDEINAFIKAHINHITKVEFISAYHNAYHKIFTEKNIKAGFRGAGLIPFDPESVISKLDVKLVTPEGSRPSSANSNTWTSRTPKNPLEAISQSTFVQTQINRYQGTSPTKIFEAAEQMARGLEAIAHSMTLIQQENRNLRQANEALSKRRRAKKIRVRKGEALTAGDVKDILAQKEAEQLVADEKRKNDRGRGAPPGTSRRCGNCGETGHNARTCEIDPEISQESTSEDSE